MSSESSTPSTSKPQERSLNRQTILEEEEYSEALSQIIARDFFPSLVRLDATNSYLDALNSQDPALIDASVRRLYDVSVRGATPLRRRQIDQTPGQTPYAFEPSETPIRTHESDDRGEGPSKRPRYDTSLSLDNFQARYTSEDNASFTQILDDENRSRKEKYGWAWEAQRRVEAQRDRMIEGRERMLIEAPLATGVRGAFRIEMPTPAGLLTQGEESTSEGSRGEEKAVAIVSKDKNNQDEAPQDVMAPKRDTRSAGVDGWKFRARNNFMFSPGADVSPYGPSPTFTKPDPKFITHASTRLPSQEGESSRGAVSEPPSPTHSRINAAIAGTPYRPRSPNSRSVFPLIPALPSPTPAELGPDAVKQLMTMGTLAATPRILSSGDDDIPEPNTTFHIAPPTSRERISHQLSNKASKSLKQKAMQLSGATPRGTIKGTMGPPDGTPRRVAAAGNLTPAAKRLLDRTTMGTRRAEAMEKKAAWERSHKGDTDLSRVRWTPSPAVRK